MKNKSRPAKIAILMMLYGAFVFLYLCISMPGQSLSSPPPKLTNFQKELSIRLQEHVWQLAGVIGERHYGEKQDAYNKAAEYIATAFKQNGLVPYEDEFGDKLQYRNIVAEHYGTTFSDEVIVIGAHYDSVWGSPGADDNASGVAVMLEVAKELKKIELNRTIRFVAFANKEYPSFLTDNMGSLFHVKRSHDRGDNIIAMISFEMLGYYSEEANSQHYPALFQWLYPDTANFVAFVGDFNSRSFLRKSIKAFRESKQFPSEGISIPEVLVPNVRRSDHAAFWKHNIPAFMVTDTMRYRNYNFHNSKDLPNSLNYEYMARVASGLITMIEKLAKVE
jgi:Zn-dependent M28 family amino/carboxypeptidase